MANLRLRVNLEVHPYDQQGPTVKIYVQIFGFLPISPHSVVRWSDDHQQRSLSRNRAYK